ncbi:Tat pathway signal sequence domain protein [Streptomyces luteolifulvus]|uniref:Tat pathway signal sequence domain protein n=1 Tax=Streptomyces luteolifulvus TaxID=2615112 RepID=A0A6H9V9V1_9ACTN|nr:Tat pathway signal sequence domain protein [Streptomyces luteolifulvus]KAB1150079.1 Tat pathway signal sequence domain protein [Streptomyces luteolifulvus]
MRKIVHRHLGKVVAGAAIAVAGTAVMVGVTLPGTAGADEAGGAEAGGRSAQQAGQGQDGVRPGVVEQAPAEGSTGKGRDPLTDDEIKRVEQIAVNRQLLGSSEDVEGERGPQRLTVDLAEPEDGEADDPNAPRRAEVSFYDYKNDALVTKIVDLATGKVVQTGSEHGVQPPMSRAENAEAAALLIADPLGAGLKADYKDATGKELTSPDQLLLNGAVYRAAPGAQPAALDKCGEHRCVRLFPKVKNGPWIDARSLVIDLSARKVAELTRG